MNRAYLFASALHWLSAYVPLEATQFWIGFGFVTKPNTFAFVLLLPVKYSNFHRIYAQ
jgi:hypothetical protein